MRFHITRLGSGRIMGLLAVSTAVVAAILAAGAGASGKPTVSVMTRNVYLGADLELGVHTTSLQSLVNQAGVILKQVDQNNFRVRSRGLAAEILSKKPDLVGLQEVALWRTGPCTENPLPPKATHVRYDYLALLMKHLNADARRYRVVMTEPEFDFEVWVNMDGNAKTSKPHCPYGSELNGRLTMRDVILARTGVKTSNPMGGHFKTLLQVKPGGAIPVDVTRGWAAADVKVPGAPLFRFVDTHLEAFDNKTTNHTNTNLDVGNGQIRGAQAKELVAPGGPATGKLPVILVGDLNSDKRTAIKPGDALAFEALRHAGFVERSTTRPGCCLKADVLTIAGGGRASQFNHQVDHVMTDDPNHIKLLSSSLTGGRPVHGYWDSDHEGLFSLLTLP